MRRESPVTTRERQSRSSPDRVRRVFIVDDHPLVRAGTGRVIELDPSLTLCGESGQGRGVIDQLERLKPDVILLDLSLPDCSGLELIKDIRAYGFEMPILVVSMHDEGLYAERVLKAGANGYLMKEEATESVITGIKTVLGGNVFLSDSMGRRLLNRLTGADKNETPLHHLSDREFEIYEMIGKGIPPRDIASKLGISPKTVDAHRCNIKRKLGFTDGMELVRYAVRWVEAGPETG